MSNPYHHLQHENKIPILTHYRCGIDAFAFIMPWQWLPVQVLETGPKLDKLRLVESRLVKFELAKMRVMAHDAILLGNEVWERHLDDRRRRKFQWERICRDLSWLKATPTKNKLFCR